MIQTAIECISQSQLLISGFSFFSRRAPKTMAKTGHIWPKVATQAVWSLPTAHRFPLPPSQRARPKGTTKPDKIRQKATNHDRPPMPMDFHPQTNQNRPWLMRWPLPDVWDAMSCRMAPRTPFPRHAGSACRRGPKVGTSRLPAERMPPS